MKHNTSSLIVLAVVVSVIVSSATAAFWLSRHSPAIPKPEDAVLARVLASGTIRCGYVIYPPGIMKDPNTGQLSGIFVDAITKAASNLGLKVQWTEEVGWGTMIQDLSTSRYDLVCAPVWANSPRAKQALFTVPLYYSGIGVYMRSSDSRNHNDLGALNTSTVRIANIDGEEGQIITQEQFPSSTVVSLPQLSDVSQELLEVVDNKADVAFVEPYIADQFLASHPGTLVNLVPTAPIRVFPNTMMLSNSAPMLQAMLNTALEEIINSGYINSLFTKYAIQPGSLYPDALPYRIN